MMNTGKRSPLTDKPLRNPGQSLDEEIRKVIDEDAFSYIIVTVFIIIMAILEWVRWYKEESFSPVLYSAIAATFTAYSTFKVLRLRKRVRSLRLGRDGERIVGQYLELLREKGYRIFHDLLGDKFNLDHVIVCEHGIFVIETKTYSKPADGKPEVLFDGKSITVNGFNTEGNIISQAQAQVSWLQSVIKESTGKSLPIKPVVVFPGWYIKTTSTGKSSSLWVLNPKALSTYIGNLPKTLSKEDMMLVSYHLSRFIRTHH